MTNLQSLKGGFEEKDPTLTKSSRLWWRRNRGLRTRFRSRRNIKVSKKTSERSFFCAPSLSSQFFPTPSVAYACLFIALFSNHVSPLSCSHSFFFSLVPLVHSI
ncbi:hypothetical protein VNO77_02981 [Canavalia gladiata]|uniref:Uncharacterized protein n=1 Tax=Canavalia gladiata TaxID=3824 RepID=A0AAN9MTY6_CANGL